MHFRRFVNAYYLDLPVNKHLFEMKQQTCCIMQSNMTIGQNGQNHSYFKQRRTVFRPTKAEYCLQVFCILLICFKLSFYKRRIFFINTIRMSNSLNPDQGRCFCLLCVETGCKNYHQLRQKMQLPGDVKPVLFRFIPPKLRSAIQWARVLTQQVHNLKTTSYRRQCDVMMTSH